LKEDGEVSENSYFQESEFENTLFSVARQIITEKELAKIRFSLSWARR
jgi:hypothetical protein